MPKIAVAFAVVALLAACGASGDDEADSTTSGPATSTTTIDGSEPSPAGDEGDYADALVTGLASGELDAGQLVVTDDEARCIAPKWISIIGVDALVDAGVAPEDLEDNSFDFPALGLDTDQGGEMVDVFADCDVEVYDKLYQALSVDLDETQAKCLRKELDDDLARDFLVEALVNTDLPADLQDELDELDKTCKLSDEPAPDDGGPAAGDDPTTTTAKPGN